MCIHFPAYYLAAMVRPHHLLFIKKKCAQYKLPASLPNYYTRGIVPGSWFKRLLLLLLANDFFFPLYILHTADFIQLLTFNGFFSLFFFSFHFASLTLARRKRWRIFATGGNDFSIVMSFSRKKARKKKLNKSAEKCDFIYKNWYSSCSKIIYWKQTIDA